MKIAIIGTGIAGHVAAHRLHRDHDITVFEAGDHVGGHTHTLDVELDGGRYAVDTGFIVFNDRTYPNFIALLDDSASPRSRAAMSFCVRDEGSGLEYNGTTLNTLFAQRRNLLRPSFLPHARATSCASTARRRAAARRPATRLALGDFLSASGFSRAFVDDYLVPMGAAIWSADPARMLAFPGALLRALLPQPRHAAASATARSGARSRGGSRALRRAADARRSATASACDTPVESVRRMPGRVMVKARGHERERLRRRVSRLPQRPGAARCCADPTPRGARDPRRDPLPGQRGGAAHRHARCCRARRRPGRPGTTTSRRQPSGRVAVTYNMNILQRLRRAARRSA